VRGSKNATMEFFLYGKKATALKKIQFRNSKEEQRKTYFIVKRLSGFCQDVPTFDDRSTL